MGRGRLALVLLPLYKQRSQSYDNSSKRSFVAFLGKPVRQARQALPNLRQDFLEFQLLAVRDHSRPPLLFSVVRCAAAEGVRGPCRLLPALPFVATLTTERKNPL